MHFDFREQLLLKSDEELIEVYRHSHDYQESYIAAVREELQKRKVDLADMDTARVSVDQERYQKLRDGTPGHPLYLALAFATVLPGGIIGLIAGYVYRFSKRDGFYYYDEKTRKKGEVLIILSIVSVVGYVLWLITKQ